MKRSVDGGLPGLGEGAHRSRDPNEPVAALGPRGPAPCSQQTVRSTELVLRVLVTGRK